MKKWQETRNYRCIKNNSGAVIAYIITVDGVDVEVSKEVYSAYSQMDRRERYIAEEVEGGRLLSLDKQIEDGIPLESFGIEAEECAESVMLNQMKRQTVISQEERLISALSDLGPCEKDLIQALFFDGISVRAYAKKQGVRLNTIQYRRDRVLKKLRQKIFL